MIDTLGLVWPLWLTSTGSRLAPVIISGLKCRIGNGGAAAVYSAPFLLDWWITSLSSRKLYLPWVFQSDWVSLCSRATEKQYVLSSSVCPRVKWLITGKHILWKMTLRRGQTSSRAHKCHSTLFHVCYLRLHGETQSCSKKNFYWHSYPFSWSVQTERS